MASKTRPFLHHNACVSPGTMSCRAHIVLPRCQMARACSDEVEDELIASVSVMKLCDEPDVERMILNVKKASLPNDEKTTLHDSELHVSHRSTIRDYIAISMTLPASHKEVLQRGVESLNTAWSIAAIEYSMTLVVSATFRAEGPAPRLHNGGTSGRLFEIASCRDFTANSYPRLWRMLLCLPVIHIPPGSIVVHSAVQPAPVSQT